MISEKLMELADFYQMPDDERKIMQQAADELRLWNEKGCCAKCEHNSFENSAPCFRCPAGISYSKRIIAKVVN